MSTNSDPLVITNSIRTPIGQYCGNFANTSVVELANQNIKALLKNTNIPNDKIDAVILGCVLSAGIGQAPARQASLLAGLPQKTDCTTINKMCGSGMKALMLAHDLIQIGTNQIMIAGGMESMTNAPYLLPRARQGYHMGHGKIEDHMFVDGLEDAYEKGTLMGLYAEEFAKKNKISRQEQDEFALCSLERAQKAIKAGYFNEEITPITTTFKKETKIINADELPGKAKPEKIPKLKPAFITDGTITAANASAISDGACVHLLMRQSQALQFGIKPLAKILAHSSHSQEPSLFTTAPIIAIQKLLKTLSWKVSDCDLFEINEAFAIVTLSAMKELNIPHKKVNIHGGACALGHPIGASGARIVTTLIHALKRNNLKKGIAAICIGGGEATAIAIEVI